MGQAYVERRKVIITGGDPFAIDITGNSKVGLITDGTWTATDVALEHGGTGASDAANARTNLGVVIGTNVQAYNATLDTVANGTYAGDDSIVTVGTVTAGTWTATDVGVEHGGTGASDAANARTNLGVAIGVNVQAYSATLDTLANGSYAGDDSIVTVGTVTAGTWNASIIGVQYGGTGASDTANARVNLGLGSMAVQNADNVAITGGTITANSVTVSGNLIVNGTTTTINSTEITVDDKNITLGDVANPTDTTADGGGVTLKGATDKTFNWVDATDSWTSSENMDLAAGKVYNIGGTNVLSNTALGSGVVSSSLTSVGTITTGTWSATDVAVEHGGTGASDAANARTNLGVAIGVNVQAYNATLDTVANGTYAGDDSIVTVGTVTAGTWNASVVGVQYGGTGASTLTGYVKANGTNTMTASASIPVEDVSGFSNAVSNIVSTSLEVSSDLSLNYDSGNDTVLIAIANTNLLTVANGTYAGDDSIVTVGTVTAGTWSATDVAVEHGGTGASDAANARTNLGVAIGVNVQAYNATLDTVANGTYAGDDSIVTVGTVTAGTWNASIVGVQYGGTGASDTANARVNLGLGSMAVQNADNVAITGGTITANSVTVSGNLIVNGTTTTINSTEITVDDKNITLGDVANPTDTTADGGGITLRGATNKTFNWVDATDSWTSSENMDLAAGKVYNIGGTNVLSNTALGSGVVSSSLTSVGTITTGTWAATDVAVEHGGTGASDAANARTNLGVAIGVNVQAYNATLDTVANGTYAGDDSIVTVGTVTAGTWSATDVAVEHGGTGASDAANARTNLGVAIGVNVQAYNATLDTVANGTYAGDDSIVTVGTVTAGTWNASIIGVQYGGTGASDTANARVNLGLGSMAVQNANSIAVTGGTLSGITSLSIEGLFNSGVTLAANTYSNAKVSIRTPVVNFKSVAETSLFTVPTGYMFLIDSMEVLTTSVVEAGTAPTIRFGNTSDSSAYYSNTTSLSNSLGARHVIDVPQDGAVANTVVTFGVTTASTASTHQGVGIVTGYLVKLS